MGNDKQPVNKVKKVVINDYLDIENAEGLPGFVDATIALDLLLSDNYFGSTAPSSNVLVEREQLAKNILPKIQTVNSNCLIINFYPFVYFG